MSMLSPQIVVGWYNLITSLLVSEFPNLYTMILYITMQVMMRMANYLLWFMFLVDG